MPDARYLVFTSYQCGKQSVKPELQQAFDHTYYEVINMVLAQHPQTILAYEMNGDRLPIDRGAPLRLERYVSDIFDNQEINIKIISDD